VGPGFSVAYRDAAFVTGIPADDEELRSEGELAFSKSAKHYQPFCEYDRSATLLQSAITGGDFQELHFCRYNDYKNTVVQAHKGDNKDRA